MARILKRIPLKLYAEDIAALLKSNYILVQKVPHRSFAVVTCTRWGEGNDSDSLIKRFNVAARALTLDGDEIDNFEAEFEIKHAGASPVLQTAVSNMRVGHELEFLWIPNAVSTAETHNLDIYCDIIYLIIYTKYEILYYTIDVSIGKLPNDERGIKFVL